MRELGDKHSSAQRRGRRSYDFNRVVEASEPGLHASGRLLDVVLEDVQVDVAEALGKAAGGLEHVVHAGQV